MKRFNFVEMDGVYGNIRELRIRKGYTQAHVADKLFMVVSAYSKIERGETELTVKRLFELSEIFGVSYLEILGNQKGRLDGTMIELKLYAPEFLQLLRTKLPSFISKHEEPVPFRELNRKDKDFIVSLGINGQKEYDNQGMLIVRVKQGLGQKEFEKLIDDVIVYSFFHYNMVRDNVFVKMWDSFIKRGRPKFYYKGNDGYIVVSKYPA